MSTPLRVLHVTRDFPPQNNGGLSTAVGGLVAAQASAGIECAVLSFDDFRPAKGGDESGAKPEQSSRDDGVAVIRVTGNGAGQHWQPLAARWPADIVHVHHESLWGVGHQLTQHEQRPTVFTVHVLQAEQNRLRDILSTRSSEAQDEALGACSIVHAPSQAVADRLLAGNPSLEKKLVVLRLGHPDWPGAAAAATAAHRTADENPLLLYVGRFADINGFAELLRALPVIFAAHPTLRATIAGGLPGNARAERRWKRRWETLAGPLAPRLHWAGWLSPGALSRLYGEASMLVVPSWFETFGQVALEGMLHGVPLITTGAGALAEIASDTTARLIPPRDASAIAGAVDDLLADADGTETRRQNALVCA